MSLSFGIRLCSILLFTQVLAFSQGSVPALPDFTVSLQTPYHTEQEWIISSICRNIFELLSYAKNKKGELIKPAQLVLNRLPGDTLSYDVTLHGANVTVEATLQWPDSIWSPSAYAPFCKAGAQALQLESPSLTQAQGNPLHALLDFSEAAIEAENQRVSQWLTAQPDNAAAHEQAALILGTLALKETSGLFYDPRDSCNHACAHLAVAQFLRNNTAPSSEGRIANLLVGLIANTKIQNGHDLDQLAGEKTISTDLTSWLNAMRLRNNYDWRIIKSPETASALEQVEYFLAVTNSINVDQAINWVQTHSLPDRPDWWRIVLDVGFSVEAGHVFAKPSIDNELHVMQTTFPGSFQSPHLIDDLNQQPGDALGTDGSEAGTLTVINRGMWAQFFQRHLCNAICETGDFFANKWGVPEYAQQLDQDVEKNYSALTLYPNVELVNWRLRHSYVDGEKMMHMFTIHPEWGAFLLRKIKATNPEAAQLQRLVLGWFTPPFPQGTAYAVGGRLDGWGMTPADIDQLYSLAPQHMSVAEAKLVVSTHNNFTFAQYQEVMGSLLDYNVTAMTMARHANDITFDQRLQLGEKAAELDPEQYWLLGYDCLQAGRDEDAAKVYQLYFDKGTDRVSVSNSMDWLVNYYYDHGQKDKAMEIAKACADVYSSLGLQTMMHLLEKMGQLDKAEEYGQNILDRYDETGPLAAFYKRQADKGDVHFKAKFDDLALKVFPEGLNKMGLASLSDPPALGITFSRTSAAMLSNGLSANQIVVALDGYGIQNKEQFIFVRALSDQPNMQFIVWDGQTYREINANLPGRNIDANYLDYHR